MALQDAINNIWESDFVQKNPTKAYKTSYGSEYAAVAAYLGEGVEPNWQSFSKLGKGLCELEEIRRGATLPEPVPPDPEPVPIPVPPVPLPPTGTPIDGLSDLTGGFVPQWVNPVVPGGSGGGGVWEQSTPKGPGFKIVCTDQQASTWNANTKNVLMQKRDVSAVGSTEDWRFSFMLPAAGQTGFVKAGHAGVLWEFHTQTDSGHHISLDGSSGIPRLRFRRWMPPFTVGSSGYTNDWVGDLKLDHWYDWRLQIKWSTGGDGFIKCSCDGVQLSDFTGATVKAGERGYLQFGFYSQRANRNEIHFGGITRA